MQGVERSHLEFSILAVIGANRTLMEMTPTEALSRTKYGKGIVGDTLGLDAGPEIIIRNRIIQDDRDAILVTEEYDQSRRGEWPTDLNPKRQPLMFFSDPTDRSKMLGKFISMISTDKPAMPIGELMRQQDCIALWDQHFDNPASITGATTSITCVRKGAIIFSVILNYITQTIIEATPDGVFMLKLPDYSSLECEHINHEYIHTHGTSLSFLPTRTTCKTADDCRRFVTFLGKTGYEENFRDSFICMDDPRSHIHHLEPGGPARILYLSELQKGHSPIGFIVANGEKIGEWIHWMSFVKFVGKHDGKAKLLVYEISIDRPWVKDGVLMSTPTPYSLFQFVDNRPYIDISQLRNFLTPNRFRSMLVVMPDDNERMIHVMQKYNYREVTAHL